MLLEVMVQGVSALSRTTRRNSDILNARSKLKPAQTLQRLYACRKISSDAILKCQPFLLRTNRGLMASMKFHVHQCTVLSNSETIHKATVIGLLSSMKRFISWIRLLHGIVGHVAKCLFSRVNASSQRCSWSPDPMAWSRNSGEWRGRKVSGVTRLMDQTGICLDLRVAFLLPPALDSHACGVSH